MTNKLLTLENIRSGDVPSDAIAVGFLLGEIERLRGEAEVADEQLAQLRGFAEAHKTCRGSDEPRELHAKGCPCPTCLDGITRSNIEQGASRDASSKKSLPSQPPIDNEHVAEGCEKFNEQ